MKNRAVSNKYYREDGYEKQSCQQKPYGEDGYKKKNETLGFLDR